MRMHSCSRLPANLGSARPALIRFCVLLLFLPTDGTVVLTTTSAEPTQSSCGPESGAGSGCYCRFPLVRITTPNGSGCGVADCGTGNFSFTDGACACRPSWRPAGISNPLNMLQGRCTQYQCINDALCVEQLGIAGATCPVIGWNCDCGLWFAGVGNQGAQCMYPWWAIISQSTRLLLYLVRHMWVGFAVAAVGLLPVGKNIVGAAEGYSLAMLQHDLAWSLFSLKLCAWSYAFATVAYLCVALAWASLVLVILLLAFICIGLLALVAACCALGGEGITAEAGCTECCALQGGEGCGFCVECCDCGACAECCGSSALGVDSPALLYFYDPVCCIGPWGSPGSSFECCGCCECCEGHRCSARCRRFRACFFGVPCFRMFVAIFPRVPENMLGGLLGCAVGTHPLRNSFDPESRTVRMLASPCWSLANRSEQWRRVVYRWLHEREASEVAAQAGITIAEAHSEGSANRIVYGDVVVECEAGFFTTFDRIFNFDDYEANRCWICQEPAESWDLWVSCRHGFCETCSGEMLRRRMPCPLCRVRSTRVRRRKAALLELAEEREQLLRSRGQRKTGAGLHFKHSSPAPQQIPPSQDAMHAGDQEV